MMGARVAPQCITEEAALYRSKACIHEHPAARRRAGRRFSLLSGALGALGVIGGAAALPAEAAGADPQFCAAAQRQIGAVTIPVRNVVHRDHESFVLSKPGVAPLETQQFSEPASTPGGVLGQISCKMKTADHIRAVHGAAAAGAQDNRNACRELNRQSIRAAWEGLSTTQRAGVAVRPSRFLLHADDVRMTGSSWTQPYQHVWATADGEVHVRAKSLLALWEDWRWKLAPESFRGTHYCHLITPAYARALMLGELQAPAPPTD
jgi:hypothetical protein